MTPTLAAEWEFQLQYPRSIRAEPFTGRVTLFFSEKTSEPRLGPDWFKPEPFLSLDVAGWQPDAPLLIARSTPGLLTYPRDFVDLAAKPYRVQAVARFNPWDRNIGTGISNGYSAVSEPITKVDGPIRLTIDHTVPDRTFKESEWSRLCEVNSPRLTMFHGRPMTIRAGVILPKSYGQEPEKRYPVIFTIPGFGGTHLMAERTEPIDEANAKGVEFLRVILDPSCAWGHHVFADSAHNGPWGSALVEDWLPEFERRFRVADHARYLTGHSSGGWASLWLQVTHPEVFHGVWSTAPDPVDFRDFQQAHIYRPGENAWMDTQGQRRPIARRNGEVAVWWDDFDRMEQVLGYGGQFQSFEAVFSPRLENGAPRPLWDRATGAIDPVTADAWKAFDIRLKVEREWPTLGPKLAGKLHVFMGSVDTFYLTGATVLLQTALKDLGSDAVVEIHEGKDHRTVLTTELRNRIRSEMTANFLNSR
ncbi:MAG: hypothetical protein B7Z55_12385 [Planctomycetales bacterium 12-60-4]|nr:MAG: hypothetical protein B7Z55_12385 [Planctomycetales bacterium 12-60-4]